MIGFFQPMRSRTRAISLAEITEIGAMINRTNGDKYHIIRLRGSEDEVQAYGSEVDALMERPMQLLPAEPGAMLLYAGADERGGWVTRTPLIGWALCLDGIIRPVTPIGVDDGGMNPDHGWFVQMAGGRIFPCGDTGSENAFDSEAELIAAVHDWWKKDQAHATAVEKAQHAGSIAS